MEAMLSEALGSYQGDDVSEGLSPALLFQRLRHDYTGFAITAKPSANLYILLQVHSRCSHRRGASMWHLNQTAHAVYVLILNNNTHLIYNYSRKGNCCRRKHRLA